MINGKTLRNTLLVIAALALAVFLIVSFGFFSASGHQSPGRIEDGVYYYSRFNCGLAYTPGEGSKLLSLPWKFGKEDAPASGFFVQTCICLTISRWRRAMMRFSRRLM